uniref:DUF38 domain-containing protein n=1 Tax=Panagrolaimus sp. ES5 TaxID=591445 RepID=A0AC34FIA7_9BILA
MDPTVMEEEKRIAKLLGKNLFLSTAERIPSSDFRENLIRYLKKNVNGRQLFKLMKVNKSFIPKKFKLECSDRFRCYNSSFSTFLWNTEEIEIRKQENVSLFFQKSLYCNLKKVRLFHVKVKFSDFKYLNHGGNNEVIYLYEAAIINDNNNDPALIDDIIDLTPKLEFFVVLGKHAFNSFTGGIARKLVQTNVECIRLFHIPESFDFQTFVDAIKEKQVFQIDYWFDESVSDEHVAKIKEICPLEHIQSWYYDRTMTEEERAANPRYFDVPWQN